MTTTKTMAVISQCVNILHDLAAESPSVAAEVVEALGDSGSPEARAIAAIVRRVAEARHGTSAVRDVERYNDRVL